MNSNQIVERITRAVLVVTLTLVANFAFGDAVIVDCNAGQSLNRALSQLDRRTPAVMRVKGTCTEFVDVKGFDDLTLKGVNGAKLVQPVSNSLPGAVLLIEASRRITVDGLKVSSPASGISGIGIGQASSDVRLRNLTLETGAFNVIVFETSQVSLARITGRNAGYASVGAYDKSDVHIEDCLFEAPSNENWHVGIDAGSGHVTVHGTTIRNMQIGMNISEGGGIDLVEFGTYYPAGGPTEVVIDNPAGTNFDGVNVEGGGTLTVGSAALRIINAGQPWGADTGGIRVVGGTLNATYPYNNLFISGSQGQGIFLSGASQAILNTSHITGGLHGGVVAVNLASVKVVSWVSPTEVGGNAVDLFCDSRSVITGGANIINAANVQCANLLAGDSEPLP